MGVAVTDLLTGHYAQSAVLASLLKRSQTGKGCHIECTLFESQIASLVNIASNYLVAGQEASRWGTEHPSIVPYQVFPTADSYIMASAGNDTQFVTFCQVLERDWAKQDRFKTNTSRVAHREELIGLIQERLAEHTTEEWVEKLTGRGLPFAPINNIAQTFAHPQAIARRVVDEVDHPRAGKVKLPAPAVSYDGEKLRVSNSSVLD